MIKSPSAFIFALLFTIASFWTVPPAFHDLFIAPVGDKARFFSLPWFLSALTVVPAFFLYRTAFGLDTPRDNDDEDYQEDNNEQ